MNRSFRVALQFLTVIPVHIESESDARDAGRSTVWFGLVGLFIGLGVALACASMGRLFPPWITAIFGVALWAGVTGGLHLDGLADCCDALPGARSATRRLEILRDPRLGSFGAIGLVLFLMAKAATLEAVIESGQMWGVLAIAPVLGRTAMVVQAWCFPLARQDGLAARLRLGMTAAGTLSACAFAVSLSIAAGASGVFGLFAAAVALTTIGAFAQRRLGGLTGDVYGATCEVVELAVMLTASIRI